MFYVVVVLIALHHAPVTWMLPRPSVGVAECRERIEALATNWAGKHGAKIMFGCKRIIRV